MASHPVLPSQNSHKETFWTEKDSGQKETFLAILAFGLGGNVTRADSRGGAARTNYTLTNKRGVRLRRTVGAATANTWLRLTPGAEYSAGFPWTEDS